MQRVALLMGVCCALMPLGLAAVSLSGNVQFRGNLSITGALSKGSGTFVIDHPLDPKNKLLYHSFVESPDVKNLYDGIAQLDENGEAEVELPGYFEALNSSYRYQFVPIGEPMPSLYVVREVSGSTFALAGGVPGGKVSWQVSGSRADPYIRAHPVIVEVRKDSTTEVGPGECLFEPLCD